MISHNIRPENCIFNRLYPLIIYPKPTLISEFSVDIAQFRTDTIDDLKGRQSSQLLLTIKYKERPSVPRGPFFAFFPAAMIPRSLIDGRPVRCCLASAADTFFYELGENGGVFQEILGDNFL